MDQDKRVMIAFALSFGVLLLWRMLSPPPPVPKQPTPPPAAAQAPVNPPPAAAMPSQPSGPATLPVVSGSKAEEMVVESDLYRVTFSTQGAVVKSWVLKKYRDEKNDLLNVVDGPACEKLGFPMGLRLANQDMNKKLESAIYLATPSGNSLRAPVKLEFTYSDGSVQVKKQFIFGAEYEAHVEVSVYDGQKYLPVEAVWPGGFGDHSLPPAQEDAASLAVYGAPGNLTTLAKKKVTADRLIPGPLELAGIEDRYFAGLFLPDSPDEAFRFGTHAWTPENWQGKESDLPAPLFAGLVGAQPKTLDFRLFVAPKDWDVLRAVKPPLDSLVDFGWFWFVAKPLFLGLRYVHDHWVHNYGWAIVILTIIINFAMFPLKLKSIRSAQEMQRIAPLVKSIQDKYKQYKFNDPRKQKMNQEVMKLYQEHNINPLGGCLPMVLQLPFLYGFYSVLRLPIELRHAPWILWIKDLSAPDTFHPLGIPLPILPTVMVITMFILQRMTPMATVDPAQQRMMMITPLIFGIMFYRFDSGLVLYFLTANLVQIAQQAFINRKLPVSMPTPVLRKVAEKG